MADTSDVKKSVRFNPKEESRSTEESDAESSEELGKQFNKFQLLNLVEDSELIETDDNVNVDDGEVENNLSQKQESTSNHNIATSSKSKRYRRRNKGKSTKKKNLDEITDDFDLSSKSIFDRNLTGTKQQPNEADLSYRDSHLYMLKVDTKNLVPENELKRIFGKSVLKEDKSKESKSGRHLYLAGSVAHQRSRFSSGAIFESGVAHIGTGPKMELDELFNPKQEIGFQEPVKKDANKKQSNAIQSNLQCKKPTYFKFVHEKSYQVAHNMFLDAIRRDSIEGVYEVSKLYPAHIESLIQLSDMYKDGEEFRAASDLIELALLIFERGFHPRFHLGLGNCQLTYRRPENRSFFIVIFKHINFTNRRGLRRTPLEYTKLLLSLDPENDPLFATLLIDFYSIRSEEYDFLIEFISNWKHLSKLPNMNFSLPLAYFMKSKPSLKKSKADSENNLRLADEYLQRALIRYPNFIVPLLDACSGEPDAELKKCDYFNYSVYTSKYKTVPESVDLLVSLYVHRTLALWKTKDVLTWLEKNIAILVDKFAKKELVDEGQHIEYWSGFRGPSPRNLLRHIVLSDLKVKIPPSASKKTILDIDPFPPESIVSYALDNSSSSSNQTLDMNSTSFGLFLRSILPNFSLGDNPTDRNQSSNR